MLPENSIDSIVTDPPYELGFMGKAWDSKGVAFDPATWAEAYRVLKPGGHLLAFGGSRTFHRIAVAIEDAGFEIRDTIMWLYGSGFPKSLDISKAIDKAAGAEREVLSTVDHRSAFNCSGTHQAFAGTTHSASMDITAPATEAAKQWEGWGTALKPAVEPIIMARKPLSGTVAQNVLQWGVGGLNIDGCRVGTNVMVNAPASSLGNGITLDGGQAQIGCESTVSVGRWPANVILDEEAATMLDEQSGVLKSGAFTSRKTHGMWSKADADMKVSGCQGGDSGGASRFFYVAKAPQSERWFYCKTCGKAYPASERQSHEGHEINQHPTQKPVELMRYLVRLVTPKGGVCLDPFAGSGTTGAACAIEGVRFVGCEMEPDYCVIATARMETTPVQLSMVS